MRLDAIGHVAGGKGTAPATRLKTGSTAFDEALQQADRRLGESRAAGLAPAAQPVVDFSKHALQRLEQRGIRLDDGLLGRLSGGVDKAAAKGSQKTLVLVDQTAFVVGVPTRTVVTVADQDSLKERVFTNIDSMVIA
jgi:flagellar operon protein